MKKVKILIICLKIEKKSSYRSEETNTENCVSLKKEITLSACGQFLDSFVWLEIAHFFVIFREAVKVNPLWANWSSCLIKKRPVFWLENVLLAVWLMHMCKTLNKNANLQKLSVFALQLWVTNDVVVALCAYNNRPVFKIWNYMVSMQFSDNTPLDF